MNLRQLLYLPEVLSLFARKYRKVRLTLRHGNPAQIRQALVAGTADIGITPHVYPDAHDIATMECRRHRRIVLAPKLHLPCCVMSVSRD